MPKLKKKLTDAVMRRLEPPAQGSVLHYCPELEGFAARVTEKNAKACVLVYHFEGRSAATRSADGRSGRSRPHANAPRNGSVASLSESIREASLRPRSPIR